MIVYQCKMCGANLPIEEGKKIVKCEYCSTFQSIPSCDDEKKATLLNRANLFRRNWEFDKACSIYENILREDEADPEIYWLIVLCKFGIEYVEDPATKKNKATINRTQQHSILQDADYLMALEKADDNLKKFYTFEATYIDELQKRILSIANEEKVYDVFISYKEKETDGNRTRSSVMAQNLYDRLENSGYRTFFSRISLEDKLGSEYEPYIYSALQSSRVMLVLGTKKEEFVAPWVRNEWSRYLLTMKENSSRKLIPCYCDVDIIDLPDELQVFQAQDMSKIGYEQDLIRGIGKILSEEHGGKGSDSKEFSYERLFKNGETLLKLNNYAEAEAAYSELCKTVPEDYRSWWGRILAITDNLTNIYMCSDPNLKMWMGCVKKLTDEQTYSKVAKDFEMYLGKNCSELNKEEKQKCLDVICAYRQRNKKQSSMYNKLDDLKKEYTRRDEEIREQEKIIRKKKWKFRFLFVSMAIALIYCCFVIFFLVWDRGVDFGRLIEDNGLFVRALAIFAVFLLELPGILVIKFFLYKMGSCLEEKRKVKKTLKSYLMRKAEVAKQIQEKEIIAQKEEQALRDEDKKIEEEVISKISKYMNCDDSLTASLLLSMKCNEFGIEKEINNELLELRNEALDCERKLYAIL